MRKLGVLLGTAVAALATAAAAEANVTSSDITSPANGTYLQSIDNPPTPTTLTITGTSDGTTGDQVDIDCFYGNGNFTQLDTGVAVGGDGSFSDTAPLSNIEGGDYGTACRMRAEPAGATTESAAFAGPRVAVSSFRNLRPDTPLASWDVITGGPNNGKPYDFQAVGMTFSSYAGWNSAGSCGPYANTVDATLGTYGTANEALGCVGALFSDDSLSRSEIQVDGKNAYDASSARNLFGRSGSCPTTCDGSEDDPGFPAFGVTQSWNPSNGFESTTSTEEIAACSGADGYRPGGQTACPSFIPSGVQLQRQITMTGTNQITMTDTWSSTDGHSHVVDALYDDSVGSSGISEGFQFPGETGFSRHVVGDVVGGPSSAPGSILVHSNIAAADGIPDENYGAITFSSAPSGFVFRGLADFEEHQTLSVPAGGPVSLTYIYSFGTTLAGVQALAFAAEDQLRSPALAITAPPNGSRRHARTVTVSGTASAGSGIKSVTVNGINATLSSGGTWSAQLTLRRGTQTLTATATSNAGLTASASVTVVYAKRCVVPHVKGLGRGKAEKAIHAAGCTIGKILRQHSSLDKGDAVGTKPKPGSTHGPGAKLKLIVSEGP